MKRLVLVLATVFALPVAPSFADVTVTMAVSINAGPMVMTTTSVTWIKGMKARTDASVMQQDTSVFLDLASKQMLMANHSTTTIADPQSMMANLPMSFGEITLSFEPSGQTKEILGRTCGGYKVSMSIPMTIGEESVTMKGTGMVWLAKDGPGVEEFKALNKAAAAAGLSTGGMNMGPQAKGMLELQKAMAERGVMFEQEIQMTMEGTGQMAQAMGQMGNMSTSMKVTAITTDPIPDDKFVLPAGYTKQ